MDYQVARRRMIKDQIIARGIKDPRLLSAMEKIPRHEFIDPGLANQAYLDRPLNIGLKQTISQPYIVAYMTEQLELKKTDRVLELGTGSGYQTAILAELVKHVYSVERLPSLSHRVRRRLYQLGYVNFTLKVGDGTLGYREESPFDKIIVTAASCEVPKPLLEQLVDGGILIIPVGGERSQKLYKIRKSGKEFEQEELSNCCFVKLYGQYGWKDNISAMSA